jgi:hypothetical protein
VANKSEAAWATKLAPAQRDLEGRLADHKEHRASG